MEPLGAFGGPSPSPSSPPPRPPRPVTLPPGGSASGACLSSGIPTVPWKVTLQKDAQNLIGISIGGGAQYCPCLYIVQVLGASQVEVGVGAGHLLLGHDQGRFLSLLCRVAPPHSGGLPSWPPPLHRSALVFLCDFSLFFPFSALTTSVIGGLLFGGSVSDCFFRLFVL